MQPIKGLRNESSLKKETNEIANPSVGKMCKSKAEAELSRPKWNGISPTDWKLQKIPRYILPYILKITKQNITIFVNYAV